MKTVLYDTAKVAKRVQKNSNGTTILQLPGEFDAPNVQITVPSSTVSRFHDGPLTRRNRFDPLAKMKREAEFDARPPLRHQKLNWSLEQEAAIRALQRAAFVQWILGFI